MPVFNEATTIDAVLDAVREHYPGEVIVIDDGSTDDTPLVLARRSDIAVVRLDHNCGYGCALRIGFDVARELGVSRLITMDCDGQHEPVHIPAFLDALDGEVAIVSGSRYLPGSESVGSAPKDRRQINERVTTLINEVTGWGITDAFCGFKAYRMSDLSGLRLEEPGYAMPLELWAKAWLKGLRVIEIPVARIYCDQTRSFGGPLDDPEARYSHYLDVWNRALETK